MRVNFLDLATVNSNFKDEMRDAFDAFLESGRYVLGGSLERFESSFADYCCVEHAVGVGTGLDALVLALRALDVGPGDEVIVPATTFIATWLAVSVVGAVPVPVDVDYRTGLIDLDLVSDAITERTKAVIPVHLYGLMVDMPSLIEKLSGHNISIVEDAAQAHGSTWAGRGPGYWGDLAAYSFYPGKNLGALGDGGAIVTKSSELAARIKRLRNYGSDVKYLHVEKGFNSRLDELQAALLSVKLSSLDAHNDVRGLIAKRYLERLNGVDEIELPLIPEQGRSSWHLFVIRAADRNRLQKFLMDNGVETLVHYPLPVFQQPAYRDYFFNRSFPVSERLASEVLSLPIGPHLNIDQVDFVCSLILGFYS